jgi:hypothetical protein
MHFEMKCVNNKNRKHKQCKMAAIVVFLKDWFTCHSSWLVEYFIPWVIFFLPHGLYYTWMKHWIMDKLIIAQIYWKKNHCTDLTKVNGYNPCF